ncbi:DNA polymerase delta catalytic subunit [Cyphellophora attinorum]|uniref:DNA polymerase delta catalytic subunit n=1 Tax=Cyphellophora attinorum TaxID=1664694 RepID=A0A0N0NKW9_9EURO|nr:DNA polymerase delta catalytic subunit [Phialophora attinorum]KPI38518.1 DNA polymerase delta catalytic subunit [Phialophora attinorum]
MPGVVKQASTVAPQKRVLIDTTNTHTGVKSPPSAKKRKLNGYGPNGHAPYSQNGFRSKLGSSQPKSQFETEVLEKMTQDIAGLREKNAETDQQWERPPLDDFNEKTDILRFQQIEIEEGTLHGGKVTLKMFGVSETGHSIMLHVTDFLHYIYVAAPVNFQRSDLQGYKAFLETQVAQHSTAIQSVQMVLRENLYGFQGNQKSPYLKITVTDPKFINKLRTTIEGGSANYKNLWKGVEGKILTFDNIQYVLRFMIDTGVTGMSWVEVKPGNYHTIPSYERQSNCQIEAYCNYHDLVALGHDGEWAKMAPLRVLSFDIECAGRKGVFPEANQDPIIQIANYVTRTGDSQAFIRNVFVLGDCSPIVNTQIFEHGGIC